MKRVTNACVGGRNFTLNDDAYNRLDAYLRNFKAKLTVPESQKAEVMDDIEDSPTTATRTGPITRSSTITT